ncbi:hypothetical protein [Streptomyces sp. NPDC048636]|uniref:hypothetical protein n=1 Tax=Streptomyces sp. NPDC048636 TaxID=3155762 RepID=UPI003436D332
MLKTIARHTVVGASAVSLAILTAACGTEETSGPQGKSGSSDASPSPAPTRSGVEKLPAKTVLAKARRALQDAESFRMRETTSELGWRSNVMIDMSGDCTGTAREGGERQNGQVVDRGDLSETIKRGDMAWVKADPGLWALEMPVGPQLAEKLKGKYGYARAFDLNTRLGGCSNAEKVLRESHDAWDGEGATKGSVVKIGGRKAIPVTTNGFRKVTVYVAMEGKPLPLRIRNSEDRPWPTTWNFSEFGKPLPTRTPTKAETVDLRKAYEKSWENTS